MNQYFSIFEEYVTKAHTTESAGQR